jgi:hypothetical protein
LRRRSYDACLARSVELFDGPRRQPLEIFPIWVANAFEEPTDEWFAAHALQLADGELGIHETRPILDDADAYRAEPYRRKATERLLQEIVEAAVDINAHLLVQAGTGAPDDLFTS